MNKNYEWYEKQLADATLEILLDTEYCKAFLLRKYPDRMSMSTTITFITSPVIAPQIVISGDLAVRDHGVISQFGYGIDFFSARLEPDYLAEKFLKQKWVKGYAIEYWKDQLAQYKAEQKALIDEKPDDEEWSLDFPFSQCDWMVCGERLINVNIITALIEFVERIENAVDVTPDWVYENQPAYWKKIDGRGAFYTYFDGSDGFGGYGFEPAEIGWLHAIQKRFAELYAERMASHVD